MYIHMYLYTQKFRIYSKFRQQLENNIKKLATSSVKTAVATI